MVRSVLLEMPYNNLTFKEFKRDMKNIGYYWEKITRGSAWMFKLSEPYNGQNASVQVDAHNENAQIDGKILGRVAKELNAIGWFNNPQNYRKFPFKRWDIPMENITVDTTQQDIEKANEMYKDAILKYAYPEKNSVCVMKVGDLYNLCYSNNDRRPLLKNWYNEFGYDRKTQKIPCLKYDNEETLETICYPIKRDGTLDTENIIIENKRYGKHRI